MRYRRGDQHGLQLEMEATSGGVATIVGLLTGALAGQVFAFTTTVVGVGPVYQLDHPLSVFGLMVKGTGAAATSWVVRLEGSLDGVSWFTLLGHSTPNGNGAVVFSPPGVEQPCLFLRFVVTGLSLLPATNIVCRAIGK